MTHLSVFGPGFKDFDKFFVGFDDQFNKMAKMHDDLTKNIPNYPPYNIKKTGDNTYVIELAVAGFAKQDIEIELADGKMLIKGSVSSDNSDTTDTPETFLFKGIANRSFTRSFALDDHIEVSNAEMINGMLKVFLERIIPEHKKPKKINIQEPSEAKSEPKSKKSTKQLLTEDPEDRNQ
jgi:molecular chaperone IbpA